LFFESLYKEYKQTVQEIKRHVSATSLKTWRFSLLSGQNIVLFYPDNPVVDANANENSPIILHRK
jgi:hypothetical protein